MAYTPTQWVNGKPPALNAENLNKIEEGIQKNDAEINSTKADLGELKSDLNNLENVLLVDKSEDIYPSLSWTIGFMGGDGSIYSDPDAILQYSNKIPVKSGDVLEISADNAGSFRFVTAFNNDTALIDLATQNVKSYTVKEDTNFVVVTTYVNAENKHIVKKYKDYKDGVTDITKLKTDVDALKTDVQAELSWTYGYYNNTTLQYWNQTAQSIVYFKCEPNTKYTINKNIETPVFQICYIKAEPQTDVTQPIYNHVIPTGNTDITYTTGDDALYVLMLCGQYTGFKETLKSGISVTSEQILFKDDEARTIITYDEAYLPNHLYMIVNKNYEIYHSQICPKAENYTFKWNEGSNFGNRVRLNYNTTGEKLLQCNIYNADGTLAKQLRTTVHVVNITSNNIYLLSLGDSLTNHCVWQSELMNMAENIVCVGSRSRIIADSDGENRTVYNEGRACFTSFNYTNGTSYANGLSDSGGDENPNRWYDTVNKKFSASYYFANNFPSSQHIPTMFTFFLGMNDLLGSNSCTYIAENIKSMIDDIRSYMPDIPIVLMAPQIRYLTNLTGDEHLRFLEFSKTLENLSKEYINMAYIPLCYGMDSLNNYSMQDITINTRYDITEKIAKDITHPYKTGYWQIADMVLGAISYLADVN